MSFSLGSPGIQFSLAVGHDLCPDLAFGYDQAQGKVRPWGAYIMRVSLRGENYRWVAHEPAA